MTPELHAVAKVAATEAVNETFTRLGIDVSTPAAVISAQADFHYLRSLRYGTRQARSAAFKAIVASLASSAIAALVAAWVTIKQH